MGAFIFLILDVKLLV
jgi:predicted outer membrane repeat protein